MHDPRKAAGGATLLAWVSLAGIGMLLVTRTPALISEIRSLLGAHDWVPTPAIFRVFSTLLSLAIEVGMAIALARLASGAHRRARLVLWLAFGATVAMATVNLGMEALVRLAPAADSIFRVWELVAVLGYGGFALLLAGGRALADDAGVRLGGAEIALLVLAGLELLLDNIANGGHELWMGTAYMVASLALNVAQRVLLFALARRLAAGLAGGAAVTPARNAGPIAAG